MIINLFIRLEDRQHSKNIFHVLREAQNGYIHEKFNMDCFAPSQCCVWKYNGRQYRGTDTTPDYISNLYSQTLKTINTNGF